MINVDDLIQQVKNLLNLNSVRFTTPEYEKFHSEVMQFVYEQHFQDTREWQLIAENLVYKSTQYMTTSEANLILVQLNKLKERVLLHKYTMPWKCIHPQIISTSQKLFNDGYFSNAAESAFVEINDRVKKMFSKIKPGEKVPDGCSAMSTVFNEEKPIVKVCDLSTETGKNIQRGTMYMLMGAMSALRNPKAHSNNVVITQEECIRRLMFASMLMYKIDEAIAYSGITE